MTVDIIFVCSSQGIRGGKVEQEVTEFIGNVIQVLDRSRITGVSALDDCVWCVGVTVCDR